MSRTLRLSLLLAVCVTAPSAFALKVRAMALPDLVRESASIVIGTVGASGSVWNDAHDTIYTDSTVVVDEVLAGRPAPQITVRQPGGAVGDVRATIAGVRYLQPGERVLLFLRTDGVRHYLVGFSQGIWRVGGTAERPTVGRMSGAESTPGPSGVSRAADAEPLAAFKARIAALLAAQVKKVPVSKP